MDDLLASRRTVLGSQLTGTPTFRHRIEVLATDQIIVTQTMLRQLTGMVLVGLLLKNY